MLQLIFFVLSRLDAIFTIEREVWWLMWSYLLNAFLSEWNVVRIEIMDSQAVRIDSWVEWTREWFEWTRQWFEWTHRWLEDSRVVKMDSRVVRIYSQVFITLRVSGTIFIYYNTMSICLGSCMWCTINKLSHTVDLYWVLYVFEVIYVLLTCLGSCMCVWCFFLYVNFKITICFS